MTWLWCTTITLLQLKQEHVRVRIMALLWLQLICHPWLYGEVTEQEGKKTEIRTMKLIVAQDIIWNLCAFFLCTTWSLYLIAVFSPCCLVFLLSSFTDDTSSSFQGSKLSWKCWGLRRCWQCNRTYKSSHKNECVSVCLCVCVRQRIQHWLPHTKWDIVVSGIIAGII